MTDTITILGIAGSLRQGSYNRAALRAAQRLTPAEATVEIFDLQGIPLFNQDDEQRPPAQVVELKARIRAADAILLVVALPVSRGEAVLEPCSTRSTAEGSIFLSHGGP
jgi:hypothetical protein